MSPSTATPRSNFLNSLAFFLWHTPCRCRIIPAKIQMSSPLMSLNSRKISEYLTKCLRLYKKMIFYPPCGTTSSPPSSIIVYILSIFFFFFLYKKKERIFGGAGFEDVLHRICLPMILLLRLSLTPTPQIVFAGHRQKCRTLTDI